MARDPLDASFVIASVFKELAANNRGPGGHVGEDALRLAKGIQVSSRRIDNNNQHISGPQYPM